MWAGWAPIGAEQTASGYDVAWKNAGTGQYNAWSTDSSGNYITNLLSLVSGSSTALESFETIFHQDLNGDGTIGPPPVPTTIIEAFGSTSLVQIGNNYFLENGGTAPELEFGGAPVTAGMWAGWAPIGAEQAASGYDVAWKNAGTGQYNVWSTDNSGNYITNLLSFVSGSSTALESFEIIFHQDLNGDGVIGVPNHTSPTLELAGVNSESVTFTGSTNILVLDTPSTFSGQIIGFTGDGTLIGSEIDLRGINYTSTHSSFDSSTGVLHVNDGTTTADLHFVGAYSQANFKFTDDGNGGTIVYDPSTPGQSSPGGAANASTSQITETSPLDLAVTAGHDSFVFAPNFGQVTITNFTPATDTIQISQSIFANMTILLAATHDDPHGNAVIIDAAHDTITIQHVTTAQLLRHQNDFHFV
jgi:hypothetical protein